MLQREIKSRLDRKRVLEQECSILYSIAREELSKKMMFQQKPEEVRE